MGDASEKLQRLRPVVFRYRATEQEPASEMDEYEQAMQAQRVAHERETAAR